jgi:hypothetical protein
VSYSNENSKGEENKKVFFQQVSITLGDRDHQLRTRSFFKKIIYFHFMAGTLYIVRPTVAAVHHIFQLQMERVP